MGNIRRKLQWLLTAAAASGAIAGCGGGADSVAAGSATSTAAATPAASSLVAMDADLRKKVQYLGPVTGFVATRFSGRLPVGTADDYDILVVGDADALDAAGLASVKAALEFGKEIVLDGPSDQSDRLTHAKVLDQLVGMSISSAAVRIQKEDTGYSVTPIDAPAIVAVKALAAGAAQADAATNSVENIFALSSTEVSK